MENQDSIQLFENQQIRTAWDTEKEEWYFSIVDVIGVLTDQADARHAAKADKPMRASGSRPALDTAARKRVYTP